MLDDHGNYHYYDNKKRGNSSMKSAVKSKRITILGSPDFKVFLNREAKKEGVSLSQLVRQRCENKSPSQDEELLAVLLKELSEATARAKLSLEKGLTDAENVLSELRGKA
ncbi:MAG: hypothetical protein WCD88_03070 [Desulfobacterales bacterium]